MRKRFRTARFGCLSLQRQIQQLKTLDDCVCTVRSLAKRGDTSSDAILQRLVREFSVRPLTEESLRVLSLLHQQAEGSNGEEEFCTTTLWLAAIQSIIEMMQRES